MDLNTVYVNKRIKKQGPTKITSTKELKFSSSTIEPYRKAMRNIPEYKQDIRVFVGSDLESEFFGPDLWLPSLTERINRVEDEFYRQYGYLIPRTKFEHFSDDPDLPTNGIRILVLNQESHNADAEVFVIKSPDKAQELFGRILLSRAMNYRVFWLRPERVLKLKNELHEDLQQWLDNHYSLTDFKNLLRMVVNPSSNEIIKKADVLANKFPKREAEKSLRHFPWLIASLVFWEQANGLKELSQVAENLRRLQKARFDAMQNQPKKITISESLHQGIRSLKVNKLLAAQQHFAKALSIDKALAEHQFLQAYAQEQIQQSREQLTNLCKQPHRVSMSWKQRIALREFVQLPANQEDINKLVKLKLCLLSGFDKNQKKESFALRNELLKLRADPGMWKPLERAMLGFEFLKTYDPITSNTTTLETGKRFLTSALTAQQNPEMRRYYYKLIDFCLKPGAKNWCWQFADEIVTLTKDPFYKLELGYQFSYFEPKKQLMRSMLLADDLLKLLNVKHPSVEKFSQHQQELIYYFKANAVQRSRLLENSIDFAEPLNLYEQSINNANLNLSVQGYKADIARYQNDFKKSKEILIELISDKSIDESEKTFLYADLMDIAFIENDMQKLKDLANLKSDSLSKNNDLLFVKTLCQIFSKIDNWHQEGGKFLLTKHVYTDYIAMIIYANMLGKAKDDAEYLLRKRWEDILGSDNEWRKHLSARLRGGDARAWREMLIASYQNEVDTNKIIEVLENPNAFTQSDFSQLPLSRKGLLTEIYFYDAMLAKGQNKLAKMEKRLRQVIDLKLQNYHEYAIAVFLLKQLEKTK